MTILNKSKVVNRVVEIPVENIFVNPFQPRKVFNNEQLESLAKSISTVGLIQPIVVRSLGNDKYQIVSGERRFLASKMLKEQYIKCIVENYTDRGTAVSALVENIERANLNFFEEAEAIYTLIKDFGYTQDQLTYMLSRSQSSISNKLRLLKLSDKTKKSVLEHGLTERHARALLKLDEERALTAIENISKQGLTVDKAEKYINEVLNPVRPKKSRGKTTYIIKDYRIFVNSINNALSVMRDSGINADAKCEDDGDVITYTVTIPKSSVYRTSKCQQTSAS